MPRKKTTKSEVPVQLDCPVCVSYGGPHVTSPMARLSEHVVDVGVFGIEVHRQKSWLSCLTYRWGEVVDRAVIPLPDERASKSLCPKAGL
jgi:hypothetical protein